MIDPFARLRRERAEQEAGADTAPRPASASRTQIVEIMEIEHTNNAGNVHGGTIMRLVDNAAGIAAQRFCRRRVVTAAMDEMSFLQPVYIGDLVTVTAVVTDSHRTSMEVAVRVDCETVPTGDCRHVATAYLVFVALDENGRPAPVPPVVAESEDEKLRQAQAHIRREQRLLRKQALLRAARAEAAGEG